MLRNSTPLWKLINDSNKLDAIKKDIDENSVSGYIIGDSAFPLHKHLLRSYPEHRGVSPTQTNFNKRISAARRVVENAFGRLKTRFRKLYRLQGNKKTFKD